MIRFSNLLLVHNDQINDLLEPSYVTCRYIFNKKLQLLLVYADITSNFTLFLDKRECWQWYPC